MKIRLPTILLALLLLTSPCSANGLGNAYAMGAYNTVGADYAKYFEWTDGNIDNDDRVGYL